MSLVPFPEPHRKYFAESFAVRKKAIYFPLNSYSHGASLFAYNRNRFHHVFDFRTGDLILGCKISRDTFIGAISSANQIIMCDLHTGRNRRYIDLQGSPNDVCVSTAHIYCAVNGTQCGLICRVHRTTLETTTVKDHLGYVTGIQHHNGQLYVSLLNKVQIYSDSYVLTRTIEDCVRCPIFDNITVHENSVYVAIHQHSRLLYFLLAHLPYVQLTIPNIWRVANQNKVSFMKITDSTHAFYQLDRPIDGFDDSLTQIQIVGRRAILTNIKAKGFCIERFSQKNPKWSKTL